MIIIGELINSTRTKVKEAIKTKDEEYIRKLVRIQVKGGADYLDVNAATSLKKEGEDLKWLIKIVQEETDLPLSIDTPNPEVMEEGIKECKKSPIMNSITNEKKREDLIKIAKEYNVSVIALPLGLKKGMPSTVEARIEEAKALLEELEKAGIEREKIYFDTLVLSVGSKPDGGRVTIDTLKSFKKEFVGVKTVAGLSNISFGLPGRTSLNSIFLSMMIEAGLDGAIIDPTNERIIEAIKVSEALLGKDKFCREYIKFMRGKK